MDMHLSHLVYAVGPEGLAAEAERLEEQLGGRFRDGGVHPRFGTQNRILPLTDARYVELVEVLDHPAAEKAVFGQAVRAASEKGGGWLGWVIVVDDISVIEQRLGRQSVPGSRHFPDGRLLEWAQIGIKGLMADPQLPYFIQWRSDESVWPSALPGELTLSEVEISGTRSRVEDWIGAPVGETFDGVKMSFTGQHGQPGINAASFQTPKGLVRI